MTTIALNGKEESYTVHLDSLKRRMLITRYVRDKSQDTVVADLSYERLDEDPEDVSINRRDVPPTPENSVEARTEGA